MSDIEKYHIVMVSSSSEEESLKIARALIKKSLAGCVSIIPKVKSVYKWEGQIEESSESLLLIKALKSCYSDLETAILKEHSYDLPEIIAVSLSGGYDRYLDWLGLDYKEKS